MKKLRIGFLSAAGIGKKNWKAIFNSGNCVVSAVASRDVQKSRDYIRECQDKNAFNDLPEAFGTYEELIASSNVDAVYIPLPTGLRKEWVLRAAAAGKHVVCEKPCAGSLAELEEMLAACKTNSVQFMDGVMFMHSPRLEKVREILNDGKSVGSIRRIVSAFSFYPVDPNFFQNNIRLNGVLEPDGCLGDLGWYSIRFALWALDWKMPKSVTAKILSQTGSSPDSPSVPTEFSAELLFEGGISFEFYCSFLTGRQQWVHVSGQKGWLRLPDFVHPLDGYEPFFEVNEKMIHCEGEAKCPPGVDSTLQGHPTAQDTRMFRNFANQTLSGKLNEDWPMWALKTQKVMEACHEAARTGAAIKL